jgi:hypothetical protein
LLRVGQWPVKLCWVQDCSRAGDNLPSALLGGAACVRRRSRA